MASGHHHPELAVNLLVRAGEAIQFSSFKSTSEGRLQVASRTIILVHLISIGRDFLLEFVPTERVEF